MSDLRPYERGFDERRLQQQIDRAELNATKRAKIGDTAGSEEWKIEAARLREQLAEMEQAPMQRQAGGSI